MFYVKKKSDALHKKWVDSKNKKCLVIQGASQTGKIILSILVDTFVSKISLTMQPGPKIDSISGA